MSDSLDTCPRCNGPQIEIDHYGELARRLHRIWRGSQRLFMELPDEDLEALKTVKKETAPGGLS
jgi:hypothetical protein